MRSTGAVVLAGALAALLLGACGNESPPAAPAASAPAAGAPDRQAAVVMELLRAIDARDAAGFARVSADVKAGKVRRLVAADVTAFVDELHEKYGQMRSRTLPGGNPALPGWPGTVHSTLVAFGDDEFLVRLWFVEDGGDLLLARISDEDAAALASPPK
jgi:hypothetical protein